MLNTPSPSQVGCIESLPRAAARPRRSRDGRRSLLSVLAVGALLLAAFPSAAGAARELGAHARGRDRCRAGRRHRGQLVRAD